MKKVFFGILAITMVGLFSSCKKECTCTYYENGDKVVKTIIYDEEYLEGESCKDNEFKATEGGVTYEVKCK